MKKRIDKAPKVVPVTPFQTHGNDPKRMDRLRAQFDALSTTRPRTKSFNLTVDAWPAKPKREDK